MPAAHLERVDPLWRINQHALQQAGRIHRLVLQHVELCQAQPRQRQLAIQVRGLHRKKGQRVVSSCWVARHGVKQSRLLAPARLHSQAQKAGRRDDSRFSSHAFNPARLLVVAVGIVQLEQCVAGTAQQRERLSLHR